MESETDAHVKGLRPWFPWPLSRWAWLTEPVRAERWAALRIGLAFIMLLDILLTVAPVATDYFGADSLAEPRLYRDNFMREDGPTGRWSIFHKVFAYDPVTSPAVVKFLIYSWAAAAFLLLIGLGSRLAAFWCFVMSVSLCQSSPNIDNAGDTVRSLALFYLFLSPSGAAWAVDAWIGRRLGWEAYRDEMGAFRGVALVHRLEPQRAPYFIHPWPLCLLFVQMMAIYLFNGIAKSVGTTWHDGTSLHNVLGDLTLARWSAAMLPMPGLLSAALTHLVLWWELLFVPLVIVPWHTLADVWQHFPYVGWLHVLFRWTREITLFFGASFHVGILVSMEIGGFAPYMLCLYLPLLPWEKTRWATRAPERSPT